ncbi:hypothetical protein GGI25_004174 [Coemansia spiralis]|uniref:Peptidase M16 N-terminal domain-containing protein n=2 Tax=Coemansia TaxID=4863 RepID=A0A9W8KXP1_9FUNG|nr:hypothetical protein BX070DRAFT_230684 [Coemansia spiralis]KAJ1987869.1 hypothetical protein EDC05_005600 [Coemansia umbellata]KAJ2618955.1 hypothetical protein GGI26_006215 [Coemansia sp. RSA 1358]KAJ2675026.1 hypothetical protein GGI25_004174 [Coemansia spiralis]
MQQHSRLFQMKLSKFNLPYYEYIEQMKQPPSDKRQLCLLCLPNNMMALCTHDPKAEKSAASLAVNIGRFDEPAELQEMAYFLEHMLSADRKEEMLISTAHFVY